MLLVNQEACVSELMEVFDMAQSKISFHLITLRKVGFLLSENRGRWRYYGVNTAELSSKNSDILNLLLRSLAGNKLIVKDQRALAAVRRRKMV